MLEVGEWWMLIDLFQWWRICQCCPGHWLQELVCSLSLREPSYQRPRLFTGFSDTLGIGSLPVCWWWSNNSPFTCLVLFSYEPARCFPGAYFAKITWKLREICTYYITWLCFHTSNHTSQSAFFFYGQNTQQLSDMLSQLPVWTSNVFQTSS